MQAAGECSEELNQWVGWIGYHRGIFLLHALNGNENEELFSLIEGLHNSHLLTMSTPKGPGRNAGRTHFHVKVWNVGLQYVELSELQTIIDFYQVGIFYHLFLFQNSIIGYKLPIPY